MTIIVMIITIIMILMTMIRYASEFLQNVSVGRHRQCGDSQSSVIIEEFKDGREVIIVITIIIFTIVIIVIISTSSL